MLGFILKKFVATFLMPLPIAIALIALALYWMRKEKKKRAVAALSVAIIWLSLLSYAPISNYLLHHLESAYPALLQAPKNSRYIYVLGSGHNNDSTLPITSQVYDDAVIRLDEAIRLYIQLHKKAKIILSGYSGYYSDVPHALMQKKLALALGIDPGSLIVIPEPKDTQEEAIAAKKLIGKQPFIIVTSAFHMARAMRWFEKEGLHPIPAPTHHMTSAREIPYYGVFSAHALLQSTIFIHELIGIAWQKVKG